MSLKYENMGAPFYLTWKGDQGINSEHLSILLLPSLMPSNSRGQLIEPHVDNLFKHFLERLEMQPTATET